MRLPPIPGDTGASMGTERLVRWLRSAGVHDVRACVNPAHAASGAVALCAGLHRSADVEEGEEVWTSRMPPFEDPEPSTFR